MKVKSLSRVRLLATPWTAAYQAPLPMECLGQLKIYMWNLNPQCDNIWIWGDNLE